MSSMWGSFCYPQGRGSYLAGHMQYMSASVFLNFAAILAGIELLLWCNVLHESYGIAPGS